MISSHWSAPALFIERAKKVTKFKDLHCFAYVVAVVLEGVLREEANLALVA